jgi:K(+)-stimulated pyrophosphate-energized sodium pump
MLELIERVFVSLIAALLSIIIVIYLAKYRVLNQPKGEGKMLIISDAIKTGARAFLHKEYRYLSIFVIIMFIIVGWVTDDFVKHGLSLLLGAFLSGACGYVGMLIAVEANVRTANAAKQGLNDALKVAFGSGGTMGLAVVACGSLGVISVYLIWGGLEPKDTEYLAAFGFGASIIALFARVGGGIYTKAADVGADLVGKVEANIPEDDARNPATIADNVGDNVGDIAGMGADLFDSYICSLVAAIQLSQDSYEIALPFWVNGFGIVASIIGIFLIRTSSKPVNENEESNNFQDILLKAIRFGINFADFLTWILALLACFILFGWNDEKAWKLWGCISIGLVAGMLIGFSTEYTTSFQYKPTISIAKKSRIGPAGVVIQGLGIGMLSTMAPALVIVVTVLICYKLAGNYGIAMSAVGMLSTLGVTLATDAFGPVADNAGGIAEMSELPPVVRERTDGLDALGNTTAATGKGFAVGSAVLTALSLLSAYKASAKIETGIDITSAEILAAIIIGACLPYIFASLTMMAVGRAATSMIEEVRRQWRNPKIANGEQPPDYQTCVEISTQASLIEMIIPGVLAIVSPLIVGYLLGSLALAGMLIGSIVCGFMLAVCMANAGGAWDNAKKFIEAKGLGADKGKGTAFHKAAVVGDTIGDPFKDTSGPSLNILIKLMSMISLIFATSFSNHAYDKHKWFIAIILTILFLILVIFLVWWMRKHEFGKIKILNDEINSYNSLQDNHSDNTPNNEQHEKNETNVEMNVQMKI